MITGKVSTGTYAGNVMGLPVFRSNSDPCRGHSTVQVGAGYVGILSVELHFPEAGSLKGKRKYVKSAKAQLQNRFGVSVAEVDHHELWQRARLTLSCVTRDYREAEQLLDEAERYLSGQEFELVRADRDVVSVE